MDKVTIPSTDCSDNLYGMDNSEKCIIPPFINFRIKDIVYNEYTYELLVRQNPDVIKKVKIKSGLDLQDLSHLNPVLYITTESLPLKINDDVNIVKKEGSDYYYYSWSSKFNRYYHRKLEEGDEFYDLQTKTKYRLEDGKLVNYSTIDLDIEYTESNVIITNSKGNGITILPATHSTAGIMTKDDKIKLDNINSYVTNTDLILDPKTPNIYLKVITYDLNSNSSSEETFLLPEVTTTQNGLMSPEHKKLLEGLYETVIEINPNFETNENGLTYFYITKNPYTSELTNHPITLPLVTHNSNGLFSKFDKRMIDKFRFVYVDRAISEVYYDGALLTNERFKVTRDQYNYYIKGNDGTDLLIESYDPLTGRAGLFNRQIFESLGTFTNTTPIVENFRGFKKGEIFEQTPYGDIINKILYPHLNPVINFAYIDPDGGIYEKESLVKLNILEVGITKKSYPIDRIEVLDENYNIIYSFSDLFIRDGGIFNFNVPTILDTINQSEIFYRIRVVDTQNGQDETVTSKFKFIYPYYYGIIQDGEDIDFTKLNKVVELKSNKLIDFTANYEKIVFGYPEYYGDLVIIKDENGLNVNGFFTKVRKNLTTSNTTVPYIFYISNLTTADKFAINFMYNK